MKSYTDLEQSKTLEKILPLESADLYYDIGFDKDYHIKMPTNGYFGNKRFFIQFPETVPCWSLAALLDILPKHIKGADLSLVKTFWNDYCIVYDIYDDEDITSEEYSNPVDACYEMILRLHEQKLL